MLVHYQSSLRMKLRILLRKLVVTQHWEIICVLYLPTILGKDALLSEYQQECLKVSAAFTCCYSYFNNTLWL